MRTTLIPLAAVLLAACASSGVIPADGDSYMLTKKNAGGLFGNAEALKGDLYAEANEFCRGKGLQVQTTQAAHESAIPFVRMGGASLHFRCVTAK